MVLFILLLLVAGVIDFGRVFNHYVVITNASREGARVAALRPDVNGPIVEAAQRETKGSSVELENDDITIDPDPAGFDGAGEYARGEPITVTVHYTVPTIIADIAGFAELPLRADTTMAIQGPD
jgi:hypothetical protein